jgi:hypothetical protein
MKIISALIRIANAKSTWWMMIKVNAVAARVIVEFKIRAFNRNRRTKVVRNRNLVRIKWKLEVLKNSTLRSRVEKKSLLQWTEILILKTKSKGIIL